MPLIVRDKYLENNSWLQGDLMSVRERIDIIINDLNSNGSIHVDYVLEKLKVSQRIIGNIIDLCERDSKQCDDGDEKNEG